MFVVDCLVCGRRQLRGMSGITEMANEGGNIVVGFRCRCCGAAIRMTTGTASPDAAAESGATPPHSQLGS